MEVLDTTTLLVYKGLKKYSVFFWVSIIIHYVATVGLAVLSGLSGWLYLITWRVQWGFWIAHIAVLIVLLVIYGSPMPLAFPQFCPF